MSNIKNIPEKIYLQIGDECDSEDFNELSEVSWCKDKIYDNDIEFALQNKVSELHDFFNAGYAYRTSLLPEIIEEFGGNSQPDFNTFLGEYTQNKVSDVSAEEEKCVMGCIHYTGGEIYHHKSCPFYSDSFSKRYDELKSEYASIINERKDKNTL